jgi:hypothetical protein
MTLLSVGELRDLVQTPVSDPDLSVIIEREEQAIIDRLGAHYAADLDITEILPGEDGSSMYLRRALTSVSLLREKAAITDSSWTTLTVNSHYYVWAAEGRIQRLSGVWGALVEVTYTPADDNAARKAVIVELVRLALERTAMKSESVAGEYSYTSPEWELERSRLLRRLGFMEI